MNDVEIKLFEGPDGIVHWVYPMVGMLSVCGSLYPQQGKDSPRVRCIVPTCVRCIVMVHRGGQGDLLHWRINNG